MYYLKNRATTYLEAGALWIFDHEGNCRKKMVSVSAHYAIERGLAHRQACTLLGISRSGLYYSPKMREKNAPVIDAMQQLSAIYPRFGSRRIRIFCSVKIFLWVRNVVVNNNLITEAGVFM